MPAPAEGAVSRESAASARRCPRPDNATFPASFGAIDKTANGDIAVPVSDVAQHLVSTAAAVKFRPNSPVLPMICAMMCSRSALL